ncbi:MAG: hypothetical protein A3H69_00805 [Candidatus Sungbacteria bacterium RIFCSPLOWO2_02_FULL_47_9]|uniref:Peptidase M50 domain-containing protein n=1 Tax=Candidatus Sungbacteria bacterium RIFCSPHIGHO2_01_FULL_47_32 TaxID=1802264 RepID=A0A1G2K4Q1_9BACT|nr:MAG: Peptidase, M50 family [Parcubacteria group bacterium GW2011_GWA2_47_10]OGZ94387.1 MAG: hypothetical protein A2633_02165 [Candidatus Sungbacteria bacterium RIFCSPHIGHO2_01_FULL_47_32]OGZ98361.1 MAG: hypothetical protein A3D57_02140 [Candidatus Sungbacteria bacterium RIFCSPHIGHO2_02_FULL_46_12]OHA04960.1 MAG: hypothetical protein A3A28_02520 [Candidatus Sungbacteria bacterium RIFCSPLOWO2_01_FULL_47_32]OHA11837.1 MAG: hypothetical protein A3H69_00805 [Candidatus Sungbacteria bacterium RIFC
MPDTTLLVLQFAILIFSAIVHEVCHGSMALYLGDSTAKYSGRLTLNPLKHFDLFGFVILPIATYLAWGFPVGAAKPVPYNPYNLKNKRWGSALVAVAGPFSNFVLAGVFAVLFHAVGVLQTQQGVVLAQIFGIIVFINLLLAVFNLVPIPPLDGSRVFYAFMPGRIQVRLTFLMRRIHFFFDAYWPLILIAFFFFGPYILTPIFNVIYMIVLPLFSLLTGTALNF